MIRHVCRIERTMVYEKEVWDYSDELVREFIEEEVDLIDNEFDLKQHDFELAGTTEWDVEVIPVQG